MGIQVLVDSTADYDSTVAQQVQVVPLTICFGDEEFIDGVTITHQQFYEKLVETDVFPTTSQATPFDFEKKYSTIEAAGDKAIVICLSSKLSGTYQSAVTAAQNHKAIYVIDSNSATIGVGILVELVLNLIDKGMSIQDIVATVEEEKNNIVIVALLDTLEYLKRGGRISAATAMAGGLLKIKPVISLVNGEISVLGKARGSKQGNNLLVQQINKYGGVDFSKPVMLGYTGLSDALLLKYMKDSQMLWKNHLDSLPYTSIGSVIGTHAGPGGIAVAFYKRC